MRLCLKGCVLGPNVYIGGWCVRGSQAKVCVCVEVKQKGPVCVSVWR